MTAGFDAEMYLRLAAEDVLLDPTFVPHRMQHPILDVASALVAIDALVDDRAQQIVDDYEVAFVLRGRGGRGGRPFGPHPHPQGAPRVPQATLTAPRVVAVNRSFEREWGHLHVHYVELSDRHTSVAVTGAEKTPGALAGALNVGPHTLASGITIGDDTGATHGAHFVGGLGGPGAGFDGRLVATPPLSRSTRWVALPDTRIELDDTGTSADVRVEGRPVGDPAEQHLWDRIASVRHGPFVMPADIERTITTLVDAGALAPDAPVIAQARAVTTAGVPGQANVSAPMPQPWASLHARQGTVNGPTGAVTVGALTPPLDGYTVTIGGLVSHTAGFEVDVATSPGTWSGPLPFNVSVRGALIRWWAEDDRGNHYLGAASNWSGGADVTEGTVRFQPALDPGARELRLLPTASAHRAVVTVALPDWAAL